MQHYILILAIVFTPLFSKAQYSGTFSLTVDFIGIDTGMVKLLKSVPVGELIFESANIKNGKAVILSKIEHPTKVVLLVKSKEQYYSHPFFIDPGFMKIKVDTNHVNRTIYRNYIDINLTGSPSNNIYETGFNIPVSIIDKKIDHIENSYELGETYPFDSIKKWANEIISLKQEKVRLIKSFIKANHQNPVVVYSGLLGVSDYTYADFEFIKGYLKDKLDLSINFGYMKSVFETRKRNFINDICPEVTLYDTNQKVYTPKHFKGKYVFMDFWASWCKPCIADQPNLLKLYEKYKNDAIVFAGISIDDKTNLWHKAIASHPLPWIQLIDSIGGWKAQVTKDLHIFGIPQYIILNPEGQIIYRGRQETSTKLFLEYIMRKPD